MHLWEDNFLLEVIIRHRPAVPDGEPGELVLTTLCAKRCRCCGTARATSPG